MDGACLVGARRVVPLEQSGGVYSLPLDVEPAKNGAWVVASKLPLIMTPVIADDEFGRIMQEFDPKDYERPEAEQAHPSTTR